MEYTITRSGRRSYNSDFKNKILAELDKGKTASEVARQFNIPIRYLYDWKHAVAKAKGQSAMSANEQMVPLSEFKKAMEQIKKLERVLGQKTLDNQILQEAVDIASKKKWI